VGGQEGVERREPADAAGEDQPREERRAVTTPATRLGAARAISAAATQNNEATR
jgi:hypothetical protein